MHADFQQLQLQLRFSTIGYGERDRECHCETPLKCIRMTTNITEHMSDPVVTLIEELVVQKKSENRDPKPRMKVCNPPL